MLQIIIVHESDTLHIDEVRDLETMESLAKFDVTKKSTDLSALATHIGETILVTHFSRGDGCTRIDYEQEKTLTNVGTDSNGLTFVEYN